MDITDVPLSRFSDVHGELPCILSFAVRHRASVLSVGSVTTQQNSVQQNHAKQPMLFSVGQGNDNVSLPLFESLVANHFHPHPVQQLFFFPPSYEHHRASLKYRT